MPLYNHLKELRARDGLNQQELGKLAGRQPPDHQSHRTRRLFALCDAGAQAGADLSGHCRRYFYVY